jgi:hypothetical protein
MTFIGGQNGLWLKTETLVRSWRNERVRGYPTELVHSDESH